MVGAKQIRVGIEGMHCASCVARVENSVSKVDGVISVKVDLASAQATIQYGPSDIKLQDIADAVSEAGYKAVEAKVALNVEGMHCQSCEKRTASALKDVEGVLDAEVSAKTGQAEVRFSIGAVDTADLIRAVETAGYKASL